LNIARAVAAVSLAGAAISSCTVHGPDAPVDKPGSGPPQQPGHVRPKSLPVAGKQGADLCLLTDQQQAQLAVTSARPAPINGPTGAFQSCLWTTPPGAQPTYSLNLIAMPMPVGDAVDQIGPALPETAAKYTVAGFPAQQAQPGNGLEGTGCRVDVDVADGQTLEAFLSPSQTYTMSNQDMCAKAKQAAEFAVGNLQQQG